MKNLITTLSCFAVLAAPLSAAPIGYVVTAAGQLGTLNIATGAFSQIAVLPNVVAGLADGPGGQIYSYEYATQEVVRINPANGAETAVGNAGVSLSTFGGLNDGRLYGVDFANSLYQVDAATGAASLIGYLGFPFVADQSSFGNSLAGDGANLYYTYDDPTTQSYLYRLNLLTGQATAIGPTNTFGIGGSAFLDGKLYGFEGVINTNQTVQLSLTTGNATLVAPYDVGGANIYGGVAAPEPATVTLAAAALGALLLRKAWRA